MHAAAARAFVLGVEGGDVARHPVAHTQRSRA